MISMALGFDPNIFGGHSSEILAFYTFQFFGLLVIVFLFKEMKDKSLSKKILLGLGIIIILSWIIGSLSMLWTNGWIDTWRNNAKRSKDPVFINEVKEDCLKKSSERPAYSYKECLSNYGVKD